MEFDKGPVGVLSTVYCLLRPIVYRGAAKRRLLKGIGFRTTFG